MYKVKRTHTGVTTHNLHFLESGKELKVPSLPPDLTGQTMALGLVCTLLESSLLTQTGAWTCFTEVV